jgi:hypothetical protein
LVEGFETTGDQDEGEAGGAMFALWAVVLWRGSDGEIYF